MSDDRHGTASDELAIRNLLAELSWHADTTAIDDLDAYVECFTDDAEWEMFGDVRRGHVEIRAGAEERRRSAMMGPGSDVRHFLGCTVVTFDGPDAAAVKSYIQAYRTVSTTPTLFLMGEYHDSVRRVGDRWKLARRIVKFG
jgi:3-phenylpropionate/cinnamic acid dioxygenase small subunit